MLRIITLVFLALLVVGGFLLAVLNDRYKIVDTFQHKFFEVTTDTGGEIRIVPLTPGFSTTSTIENMR